MRFWLRDFRQKKSYTMSDVADKCFISKSYYQKIEYGCRNVSVAVAKKIADLLEFDWKLFYEDLSKDGGTNRK